MIIIVSSLFQAANMCSLICSLVVLIPLVATQAPGDGSSSCQLIPSDGTRVLLDSFSYETLLPTPWMTLDLNNDSITVSRTPLVTLVHGVVCLLVANGSRWWPV